MQLEGGCKVHAGVSGAQLSYLQGHSSTPACLYVQSSKALLLRPAASSKASGQSHLHLVLLPNCKAWYSLFDRPSLII